MHTYNKAVAAALAAGITLLAGFGIDLGDWGSGEIVGAAATLIGAALVYFLPNKAE